MRLILRIGFLFSQAGDEVEAAQQCRRAIYWNERGEGKVCIRMKKALEKTPLEELGRGTNDFVYRI